MSFRFKPLILALSASPATAVKVDQIKVELEKLLTNLDCRVILPRPEELRPYWNRPRVSYLLKELNDYQRYVRADEALRKLRSEKINPFHQQISSNIFLFAIYGTVSKQLSGSTIIKIL